VVEIGEGEEKKEEEVKIEIIEVHPYRRITGKKELMIAYRIIDGDWYSPVAHFWMSEHDDIRKKLREVAQHYLAIRRRLVRRGWVKPK